jgi:hypothetical protein
VEAVGITLGVSMFSLSESTAKGDTAGKETQVHHLNLYTIQLQRSNSNASKL